MAFASGGVGGVGWGGEKIKERIAITTPECVGCDRGVEVEKSNQVKKSNEKKSENPVGFPTPKSSEFRLHAAG